MELFSDETIRGLLAQSLTTASYEGGIWRDTGRGPGSRHGDYIDWLTIKDQNDSVATDVERIRNHPLVPREIPIYGYINDVHTGALLEVPDATRLGRAG
jgi:carbonic anhydrase